MAALAEMDLDLFVSALDVTNAFNNIQRLHCLEVFRRSRAELAPFVELWYGRDSVCVYRDSEGALHDISANEGVEQGEPLAPILFTYGVRDALGAAQSRCDEIAVNPGCRWVRIFAYIDDVVVCAPRSVAVESFHAVRNELERLDL